MQASTEHRVVWMDSLRGFAALAVALFHGMIILWLGGHSVMGERGAAKVIDGLGLVLSLPVHYGYAGVMLFFLLSGFVIHLPYAGGKRNFEALPYFIRRFLRIYPPYIFAILLSLLVATLVPAAYRFHLRLDNMDMSHILRSFFFLQNYPHAGGPLMELAGNQPASNLSLWSLPVEMELYIAYPLVLLALRRFSILNVSIAVGAISVVASFIDIVVAAPAGGTLNWANYLPTFLHFWVIWCAGAWLAERTASGTLPQWSRVYSAALCGVLVAALLARGVLRLPRDVEDMLWGAVFFLLLLRVTRLQSVRVVAALKPLSAVGLASYSLYLIHIPLFLALAGLWGQFHESLSSNFAVPVLAVCIVLPFAFATYHVIERPSIAIARSLSAAVKRNRKPAAISATPVSLN